MKTFKLLAPLAAVIALMSTSVQAVGVTGMEFAGGCIEGAGGPCVPGSNATEENVAILLGVDETLVTQINSGFTAGLIGDQDGTWSVTDTSITHIAFKSNGYYILGAITGGATSGTWDNNTMAAGGWDISLVDCPAAVCGSLRAYTDADFENSGGNIADLSNVRAFSVVPIPAAVWLFGSGLGLLGWMRRKSSVAS